VQNYLARMAAEGRLAIPDPYAATMQLAGLAAGGSRFLLKHPRPDPQSREYWVTSILNFVLAAWEPRRAGPQKVKRVRKSTQPARRR
jgi:hypothetical protein